MDLYSDITDGLQNKPKMKNIYELKLHESIDVNVGLGWNVTVTKVEGGWIYIYGGKNNTAVFVPYYKETI